MTEGRIGVWPDEGSEVNAVADGGGGRECSGACFEAVRLGDV